MSDPAGGSDLGWRGMTASDREREYSPSSCLPDGNYRPFVAEYRTASRAAWTEIGARHDASKFVFRYGESDAQIIVGATPDSPESPPLLVFIHGGYWQELSASDSLFAANDCLRRGWAFAAIEYTLAPNATLDEIVAECRNATARLVDAADEVGFDPARIYLAGSSAGAQLAAMAALDPAGPPIAGTVLLSGIFELEPLIGTSINDEIKLDVDSADRNSPLRMGPAGYPSSVVAFGSNETLEFKAQSVDFARHLRSAGVSVEVHQIVGRNHFDVVLDLAAADTMLGDAVAALVDAAT